MFYEGKIYPIRLANAATRTMFDAVVAHQAAAMHNPLVEFVATLTGLSESDRQTAIHAFIAAHRDAEYPPVVRTVTQNSLVSAKYLVEHCLPDFHDEVTETNKWALLKAIHLAHVDPIREKVLETRDVQRWAKDHESKEQPQ